MNKFDSLDNNFNYKLVFAIAFFFIALAIMILVLLPKAQNLRIIREEIKEKRNELETKEEYLFNLDQTKSLLEGYQEELLMINHALPNNPSMPSLFNHIQRVANGSGLILAKVGKFKTAYFFQESPTFQGGKENKISSLVDIQETDFDIEVVGTYASFKEFLSKLEKSIRLIKVENISFSSGKEEEKETFIFNLKMKVYSY